MKNDIEHIHCAVTPLDGRYKSKTNKIQRIVSEEALIFYRIRVELLWLVHLLENIEKQKIPLKIKNLAENLAIIRDLSREIDNNAIEKIRGFEQQTKHDVKSVEYYLRDLLLEKKVDAGVVSLIHFACTSEDINNLSYALMMKDLRKEFLVPSLKHAIEKLAEKTNRYSDSPMLSRTHGQAASPTTLGKEIGIFAYRLYDQCKHLESIKIAGKMNGAVGNFNAHEFVFQYLFYRGISIAIILLIYGFTNSPDSRDSQMSEFKGSEIHTSMNSQDLRDS